MNKFEYTKYLIQNDFGINEFKQDVSDTYNVKKFMPVDKELFPDNCFYSGLDGGFVLAEAEYLYPKEKLYSLKDGYNINFLVDRNIHNFSSHFSSQTAAEIGIKTFMKNKKYSEYLIHYDIFDYKCNWMLIPFTQFKLNKEYAFGVIEVNLNNNKTCIGQHIWGLSMLQQAYKESDLNELNKKLYE